MNIVNLKPIIKRIAGKQTRAILNTALSDGKNLMVTDLETYLTIKGANTPKGVLSLDSLGITNSVLEYDVSDFPDFPDFTEFSKKNEIEISIKDIEMLLESVSDDETRIFLNGIAWVENELVSTNGFILTIMGGQATNDKSSSIMPKDSMKALVNLCKKFKMVQVKIQVDESYFKVDNEHFTLMGRLIAREYLKYQAVIPKTTKNEISITDMVKFKDIKDILNKRSFKVNLESHSGQAFLVVEGTEFKKEVGTNNFNNAVGFNLKYLEFLTKLDGKLMFNNELSPFMVAKGNVTRIAMPMKI